MKNRMLSICLVLALLSILALAPQAAPPVGRELPPDQAPRRMAGRIEPLPYLDRGEGPLQAESPQAPVSVPSWSRLTFQSLRDDGWEIYHANGDGSNQVRLTHNDVSDIQPDLNRGAARIAFARYEGSNYDLYAMNVDGSGQVRLTTAAEHEVNPAWSPESARLAYESYQTGDGDIYAMHATGGGQVRLTSDAAWDGEPAWSPGGTRIAFTSYRNSVYRIWLMNADGSGQVQLSNQPYSEHPAWSPDGSMIAYDADGNGDGWQELWLMNADGTNQHQVYDPPEAETDAWMASWSPDGRYLAFTRIFWINYLGNWYWYAAYLDAWDRTTGSVVRLSSTGVDWRPSWQGTDTLPPSSSVAALPAQSPSPIVVRWSGADNGPAGVATYDVQVRDGPAGTWTDWLVGTAQTSAAYPGLGGHTYYFRCRARDHAMNLEAWPGDYDTWTMVETMPPQTAVESLPPYVRGEVTVAWGGVDTGGSGVATYDVQVRDGAGDWTDWRTGVTETEAPFSGEVGHTYYFRSRGTDRAGNTEEWPTGDGDASTAFYGWAMTGTFRDNRGTPVMGGLVDLDPEALAVIPSDADGAYTAYEAAVSGVYTATWSKPGYGGLPETAFDGSTDARADMVLPPADNVVLNWGFETGSLEPEWLAGGEIVPAITPDLFHTGRLAAAFGPDRVLFTPWVNVSNTPGYSRYASLGVDSAGAVHVLWRDSGQVLYARREPGGSWSAPVDISGEYATTRSSTQQLAVQADGTVHATFEGEVPGPYLKIVYNHRSPDGSWSGPLQVSQEFGDSRWPNMSLGTDNAANLVWNDRFGAAQYARRSPDGTWTDPISPAADCGAPHVAAGLDGSVHIVCVHDWPKEVKYTQRSSDGFWSNPQFLPSTAVSGESLRIAVAADGGVHVAWIESRDGLPAVVVYTRRSASGTWSTPEEVDNPTGRAAELELALGPDSSVHLAWTGGSRELQYAFGGPDGVWAPTDGLGDGERCSLRVDAEGTAHLAWRSYMSPHHDMLYAARTAGGAWSEPINLSNTPSEYSDIPRLAIDGNGGVHVVWQEGNYETPEIVYTASAHAEQTGDSILSQELAVPPAGSAPTLSFLYRLDGVPAPGGAWFGVQVDDGLSSTPVYTATSRAGWSHAWIDLTPWAGQAVTLRFLVHQTEGEPAAWATLDEVSVGSAYPDVWVGKFSLVEAASPTNPAVFALRYGNRGGVAASGVTLVDVLPPELTFLSADPPPDSQMPQLTWILGDLPARSGPLTIVLTATMAPDTPSQQMVTNTASVETADLELETLNDEASSTVWLGYLVRLPLILRFR